MSLKSKIVHEIKKTALVTIFFLLGFNLLALMFALMVPGYRDPRTLFVGAAIAALVVGKVVVIVDVILAKRLSGRASFLGAVIAKTVLFTVAILVAMTLEELVHGVLAEDLGWTESWRHLLEEASWARFTARFVYLSALFGLYSFVFELDRYLGSSTNVLELVLSKYRHPVANPTMMMQVGLLEDVPAQRAGARASVAQELYPEVEDIVRRHGGEVVRYTGRRGLIAVPISDGAVGRLLDIFKDLSVLARAKAGKLNDALGVEPRIRAGVAAGPIHTVEVAGKESRDIVRDGEVIDQAAELARGAAANTVVFSPDLRSDVERTEGAATQAVPQGEPIPVFVN